MRSRLVSVVLLLAVAAGALSSCFKKGGDENSETKFDVKITLGGEVFKADTLNSDTIDSGTTLYTRDYKDKNGKYLLTLGAAHTGRAVFSIRYSRDESGTEFTVISADTTGVDKSATPIPVNGFLISLPLSRVDGLRIRVNQTVDVSGFEAIAPEYERMDLGTFIPENKALTRRVSYINPVAGITEQPCITLITNDYGREVSLPDGAVAFIMRLVASDNYRINSVLTGGTVPEGSNALIFVGEYNALFAKNLFTEGNKLYISRKDRISSYSDVSAIIINETVYKIGEEKTNLDAVSESGVYLYNSYFTSLVTPARDKEFIDIVIVDDTVVYKGEKNRRIMLPSNSGITVSFVGESVIIAENLSIGDTVSAVLVSTRNLPEMYFSAGGYVFELTSLDTARSAENTVVLYTPSFGGTTGTGTDGTEIIFANGKITAVEIARGNAAIPEDGYVLSVQKNDSSYKYAERLSEGTNCVFSLSGRIYSLTRLPYDSINSARYTDMLIIYKDRSNTGTNPYGYEVIVGADGKISGESYSGSAQIPNGGFVLSGHGEAEKALKAVYNLGANVLLNEKEKTITVISTPLLKVDNALHEYTKAKTQYEDAKAAFYDIDYKKVSEELSEAEQLLAKAEQAMEEYDYPSAIHFSASALDRLYRLSYSMIRSNAVENRAVWYRSNDKSDSDVLAAVQKAVSLNINTIYLETWYDGKVIGFSDNSLIKHHTARNGNFDVLEAFCRIGHEHGLEIHAWVENFFIGTLEGAQNDPDSLINKTYGKHLLDKQGNNFNRNIYGDFVFLNPYDKSNRALVFEVYKEIITKYDIDGIHLDYIRFPEYNFQSYDYGYNEDIIKGFQKAYNTSVDPKTLIEGTAMHDNWCKFREDIINSWVEEVYELVMDTKPHLWISCAAYPQADVVPKTIFQNVRVWVENGWMDEVFSMSYGTDNGYVRDNAALFKSITGDKAFYSTGLSVFGTTTKLNLAYQIDIVRDVGAEGSALFSLSSITPENYGNAIKDGSYSVRAVQTYLLNKTVSAGMSDILRKLDNVYGYDGDRRYHNDLIPLIEAIKDGADAFDSDKANYQEKIAYTQKVIADINSVISVIEQVAAGSDSVRREALKKDFLRIAEFMTQSQNRIKARMN